ncbi:hypothetical protein MPTK1_7g09960 [Marchantia polymorpha subsp. ruderalis]|uniref:Uncharacterized protein n=2 Tax=Marchantia polymorpha TaxID=3197 RepID=A0AAF6BXY1_MARPO|nr:hypothetical protein MARPO_0003s0015 [Marchantia polymorpha]BBN16865.1 hypothetical protein Mp_7g09960 [Marchantia polymorpha subsp. ruderalis]|eukprot:PTQ49104.1 hypothetical protein MARPO_0003s0015 [Marchantia polymorpha]
MGVDTVQFALPAELDTYMQDSIFHMLGFCTYEDRLKKKLSRAEESQRDLALQLQQMQFRLRESDHKRAKSKEEAVLNAQALKRQVAENQKLLEQCRALKDECNRLEQECNLYHNDRDVFMEAAYEAEDRAAEADDRATEAEAKNAVLEAELDQMRLAMSMNGGKESDIEAAEDLAVLKSRIAELEGHNASLKENLSMLSSEDSLRMSYSPGETLRVPEGDGENQVLVPFEQFEETRRELQRLQDSYANEAAARRDERTVRALVSSAVTSGICRALEEEKEETINDLNMEFSSLLRCMEVELSACRERAKFAEKNVQNLLLELQAVRQEAAICRNNLDKAEVEVQMLADENKEVRILLRRRYAGLDSPMQNKGVRFQHTLHAWHKCPQPLE